MAEPNKEGTASPSVPGGHKQLPQVPTEEMQQSWNARIADATHRAHQGFGQICLEYALMAEYNQLKKQKLPGIYVIPSASSPYCWFGILFIRHGLYKEGVFRLQVSIPENYPDGDCPSIVFQPPVFHPMVNPTSGELDVKKGFLRWRRNQNHIWQVLLFARRIFFKVDTTDPFNPEAASLYEQNPESYKMKVQESIRHCKENLYSEPPGTNDPHTIRFSPWDADVHEEAQQQMLRKQNREKLENAKNAQTSGLSWMNGSSLQMFAREDPGSA